MEHFGWPPGATHVIWLNYGRFTVFSRLLRRTLGRGITRAPLFNGNRESLRMAFLSKDSILLWSVSTYAKNQAKFAELRAGGAFAQLRWVELTKPAQAEELIQRLGAESIT